MRNLLNTHISYLSCTGLFDTLTVRCVLYVHIRKDEKFVLLIMAKRKHKEVYVLFFLPFLVTRPHINNFELLIITN
jgi:hypothetical protein